MQLYEKNQLQHSLNKNSVGAMPSFSIFASLKSAMIQRIQSVYLFLAAATGALMLALPLASAGKEDSDVYVQTFVPALILLILSCCVCLIAIALYKNRRLQMNFCWLGILCFGLTFSAALYNVMEFDTKQPGLVLPSLAIILLIFAHKAIQKDDKLVRSADRLR